MGNLSCSSPVLLDWSRRVRCAAGVALVMLIGVAIPGCGHSPEPPSTAGSGDSNSAIVAQDASSKGAASPIVAQQPPTQTTAATSSAAPQQPARGAHSARLPRRDGGERPAPRLAPRVLPLTEDDSQAMAAEPVILPTRFRELQEEAAKAVGIRKLASRRLTLYTDLPPDPEVDELPRAFDAAVPLWSAYFGVPIPDADDPHGEDASAGREPQFSFDRENGEVAEPRASYHARAFLMRDRQKFVDTGLLPDDLPPFSIGYARGRELWLNEQPSAYYRRHLLLHEGTHAWMYTVIGGEAPPWYIEGMAELLGTHRWQDGKLSLNVYPQNRDDVPYWGRTKLVREAWRLGRGRFFEDILQMPYVPDQAELYGWCWAACAFLDGHPQFRERFRTLLPTMRLNDPQRFNQQVRNLFADDWPWLEQQWQVFVAEADYGYDFERAAVQIAPGVPPPAGGTTVRIAADRGWQSSGVRLEAGVPYRIACESRYEVAQDPAPWVCEPQGVSVQYYQGLPLGMLVGAVAPDPPPQREPSPLLAPLALGRLATIVPEQSGVLYLRIQEFSGRLHDNRGALEVRVEKAERDDQG